MATALTYAHAGVDIDAGNLFAGMIKERIAKAWPDAAQEIGGFAGGGVIPPNVRAWKGAADGCGTKAIIAALMDQYEGLGQDAAAMSIVDAYISGVVPYGIFDVIDVGRLDPDKHIAIIDGIIKACQLAKPCRLFGGETAELPDMFRHSWMVNINTFVIAFSTQQVVTGNVQPGQTVYGWRSDGPASNGFSLIRKVFDLKSGRSRVLRQRLEREWSELNSTLAEALLRPTPVWVNQIETQRVDMRVKFAAHVHVTGGGLVENIPRVLPPDCKAVLDRGTWKRPEIFSLIQNVARVSDDEMNRTFNQGIMVVSIVEDGHQPNTPNAIRIGQVEKRHSDEPAVVFTGEFSE